MAAHDSFHENFKYGGPNAGSAIGTVNGAAFDCRGMQEVLVWLSVGVVVATGTLDVHVEESDDGSTGWVDVAGAVFTQKDDQASQSLYVGRIIVNRDRNIPLGRKRYLRIVGVVGTAVANYGAGFIGGGLHDKPVAQDNAVEFNLDETAD